MPRGRPRAFDVGVALDEAVELFSRQGYDGTSIAQLTEAMGLTPPQIYAAYGNKRRLFDQVVERYGEQRRAYMEDVLDAPTAQEAARRWLVGAAEHDARAEHPRGCLTVQGCLAAGPDGREVVEALADVRTANQQTLQRRMERGLQDGDLPPTTDVAALAQYLSTVSQGISVQASAGASLEQLLRVADLALVAVPAHR